MNLRTVAIITFLSVATFMGSCLKEDTTSQQLDKVKSETKEAAQEMKDYPYGQGATNTVKKVQKKTGEENPSAPENLPAPPKSSP